MDKTKMAIDIFDKRASEYQAKFMDVGLYHDTFDLFCKSIKKENAEILEFACGPGNITRYVLNKRPDFKILGIDLAPNMIELAKRNNPTSEFQCMDCRDIRLLGKKYDAVMCGFCLPYLSKEESVQLISDVYNLLESNGLLYISTMEDDYAKSGLESSSSGDQMFIHYHEADYLTQALLENGFKIIDVQRIEYPKQDGSKTTDLVIIAGK